MTLRRSGAHVQRVWRHRRAMTPCAAPALLLATQIWARDACVHAGMLAQQQIQRCPRQGGWSHQEAGSKGSKEGGGVAPAPSPSAGAPSRTCSSRACANQAAPSRRGECAPASLSPPPSSRPLPPCRASAANRTRQRPAVVRCGRSTRCGAAGSCLGVKCLEHLGAQARHATRSSQGRAPEYTGKWSIGAGRKRHAHTSAIFCCCRRKLLARARSLHVCPQINTMSKELTCEARVGGQAAAGEMGAWQGLDVEAQALPWRALSSCACCRLRIARCCHMTPDRDAPKLAVGGTLELLVAVALELDGLCALPLLHPHPRARTSSHARTHKPCRFGQGGSRGAACDMPLLAHITPHAATTEHATPATFHLAAAGRQKRHLAFGHARHSQQGSARSSAVLPARQSAFRGHSTLDDSSTSRSFGASSKRQATERCRQQEAAEGLAGRVQAGIDSGRGQRSRPTPNQSHLSSRRRRLASPVLAV